MSGQSVLLVPFPEVAVVVEPWLEQSVGARPSHGIPAHVTLLFPFPPDEDPGPVLRDVRAFDVAFRELRRFAEAPALYLAPEPASTFVSLTKALVARFPDWPPYGGAFAEIVPHLTVAWGAALDEAEAAVAPSLPLHGRAREAVLLSEVELQRWQVRATFAFEDA